MELIRLPDEFRAMFRLLHTDEQEVLHIGQGRQGRPISHEGLADGFC